MNRKQFKALSQGAIGHVTFVKKEGEVRNMSFRLGVGKYISKTSKGLTANQIQSDIDRGFIRVVDINIIKENEGLTKEEFYAKAENAEKVWKSPYRIVTLSTITRLAINKTVWTKKLGSKQWLVEMK